MKKIIYTLLILVVCSMAFTACTEEVITPSAESPGGGNTSEKP